MPRADRTLRIPEQGGFPPRMPPGVRAGLARGRSWAAARGRGSFASRAVERRSPSRGRGWSRGASGQNRALAPAPRVGQQPLELSRLVAADLAVGAVVLDPDGRRARLVPKPGEL